MKKFLVLVLALLLTFSATVAYAAQEDKGAEKVSVLIGFNDERGRAQVRAHGGSIEREFEFINAVQVMLPKAAIEALERAPGIRYVEPDYEATAIAQTVPWGVQRVNAPQVHAVGQKGAGVRVAILDTGIRLNHEDLTVYGGYDTFGTGNYNDYHGHGTHVAGTVAALDNNVGVIGVAPSARLYAVKVLNDQGSGSYSNIIAGIQWAVNNNMHIINMSLGGSSGSTALRDACDAAYNAGILLVAAAGNSGTSSGTTESINYPARYSSVMAVGATTSSDTRASFSSTGSTLEIMAPGYNILSTTVNGGYGTMSGTSMASPHVAGVAALIWGAAGHLSNVQLRQVLNTTANDMWNDPWRYGNGLVDAWAAYQYVTGEDPPPDPDPDPDPTHLNVSIQTNKPSYYLGETIHFTVTVTDDQNAPVADASVAVELRTAWGWRYQGSGTTNSNGVVTFSYTTKWYDGWGTYTISATATKGSASGSDTITFPVN